ncbi:hypothetical protein R3W88_021873 [Solanum pinnatisectum]|uniref:DUF7890 domain-containing protein n=1 Tax=Solanum pinnatisectum TaxID=50273 RepID=A0AAV9LWI6_9SOLN|nr:hypothetical protein R3W88_021873 [Solanum pinnatisectum]
MGFGRSFLKGIHFGEKSKSRKTKIVESSNITTTTYVCRDELDKKKPKIKKQVKFDLEPKYYPSKEEEENEKYSTFEKNIVIQEEKTKVQEVANISNYDGVIKVKILMKKEDAARLLIKYRNGGELEFMDVAQQLVQVPSSSVKVL